MTVPLRAPSLALTAPSVLGLSPVDMTRRTLLLRRAKSPLARRRWLSGSGGDACGNGFTART